MKFKPDGLQKILLEHYGSTSLVDAVSKKREELDTETNRREDIWCSYTEPVQLAHGIRPTVPIPLHLQSKLKMTLRTLEKQILEHKESDFIKALEEWQRIWMEAIELDRKQD